MLGILLLLAGCATWDWEAASAYAAFPQYQAYVSNLIQQQTVNQQLANQQNYENSMAMLNQATANAYAQQNIMAQTQRDAWLARRLNSIENQIGNLNRPGYHWYR
jgi:hypothetical protein